MTTVRSTNATELDTTGDLPRWDLTRAYSSVDAPEIVRDLDEIVSRIDGVLRRLEHAGQDPQPGAVFDAVIAEMNAILTRYRPLSGFLYATVTADTTDADAQERLSEAEERLVGMAKVMSRLRRWLGETDVSRLTVGSRSADGYADVIRRERLLADHLLSPVEEDLLADLASSAGSAWEKLHQDVSSRILVTLPGGDAYGGRPMPMSAVRNLAYNPDRDVRERAYHAELDAWQTHATPLAAAMNGVKGQVNVTARRRNYPSPLVEGCMANRIDEPTLTALVNVTERAFPVFRRYLQVKAARLGLDRLAWFDLFAPVGAAGDEERLHWRYDNAATFIVRHFSGFSEPLGSLAKRAFVEHWIDAGPRPGKVGGAYCMPFIDETSRILANYEPGYEGMSTLAHELGHAYHNYVQASEPILLREAPMVLAETASTFCETLIRQAALRDASPDEQLVILEAYLSGVTQTAVDILSRFRFEQSVFTARQTSQLSPDALCGLMLDAQRGTYGDALDPDLLHPFAWAAKPHYYSTSSFYNYPYLFGTLFGIGLYADFEANPQTFPERYDRLLRMTGRADPADLAADFGVDIRDERFWQSCVDRLERDVERFVSVVNSASASRD